MNILFITDNFPPEVNAPASRTYEHCEEWVKKGENVTVITCFPNYPKGKIFDGYKNNLYTKENIDGITVIRVWSFIAANTGFIKRVVDHLSFAIMAFFVGLIVKRPDVIIATSPQFFSAITGFGLSIFRNRSWIMEIRDLWPESIAAVGMIKKKRVYRLLEKIELLLYRHANKIIVVTDSFKTNLITRNVSPDKIHVIKNGVNNDLFYPRKKKNRFFPQLDENKFIIGYIGTHGLAHNLLFILECAKKINSYTNIHFVFIGDGAQRKSLIDWATSNKLKNVSFYPSINKEKVPEYIAQLNIALIPLKKSETFKSVIPSKIFENAAMGIPILLGVEGEAKKLIEKYHAGLFFEPENYESFIKCVNYLYNNPSEVELMKQGGKNLAEKFLRKNMANQMLNIIKDEF